MTAQLYESLAALFPNSLYVKSQIALVSYYNRGTPSLSPSPSPLRL